MCLAVLARSGWHALGRRVGSLYFFVNKAYSQGSVTLRSADPRDEPLVDFRMLSDRRDLERLRNAFRFVAEIAAAPELDGIRTKIFPTNYSDRVRGVSVPSLRNAMQMGVLAAMLETLPMLRGWLIDTLVTSGTTLADVLADDATLEAYLQKSVAGVWHPVGSCRMGRDDDPLAVTTPAGPRARRRWPAHQRRLGDAVDPLRQHQHLDHHGGRADGGFDQAGSGGLAPLEIRHAALRHRLDAFLEVLGRAQAASALQLVLGRSLDAIGKPRAHRERASLKSPAAHSRRFRRQASVRRTNLILRHQHVGEAHGEALLRRPRGGSYKTSSRRSVSR